MKRLVGLFVLFLFLTSSVAVAGSRYRVVARPGTAPTTAKGADASSHVVKGEKIKIKRTRVQSHKGLDADHHQAPNEAK